MLHQCRTKVVSRSYLVEFLIPPLSGSVVHEELRSLISIRMASHIIAPRMYHDCTMIVPRPYKNRTRILLPWAYFFCSPPLCCVENRNSPALSRLKDKGGVNQSQGGEQIKGGGRKSNPTLFHVFTWKYTYGRKSCRT